MTSPVANSSLFWHTLTRLGEAEVLLPAAALTMVALFARTETRRLALSWLILLFTAAVITTASKVAFMGWGLGIASIDFTGISGHAMFAAATYPILFMSLLAGKSRGHLGLVLGGALALLVGVSRIQVGAHSWSEVLAGWLVGGAASAAALALSEASRIPMRPIVPAILLGWVALVPLELHATQTHALVTRLAVVLSGKQKLFKRSDLTSHIRHPGALPGRRT